MKPPRHEHGMTLVELVVALALASLALVGALNVLRAATSSALAGDVVANDQDLLEPRAEELISALCEDLRHADWIASDDNRVALLGYGSLSRDDHRVDLRPVRIEYRVETIGGDRWVVRVQRRLDIRSNEPDDVRLVGPAPHLFFAAAPPQAHSPDGESIVSAASDPFHPLAEAERMSRIDDRVRVAVMLDPEGEMVVRRLLITR